jgi:glc operon protein GlcG
LIRHLGSKTPFLKERVLNKLLHTLIITGIVATVEIYASYAVAQTPAATPAAPAAPAAYGAPINLDMAKKAMAAAEAEARKNNWTVAIAIVDSASQLVLLQRLDNTQYASIDIAKGKATTSVNFKRPSKALEDAVAGGGAGLRLLRVDGLMPLEGGIPIMVDGKIVGVLSSQDAQVARAGADALK